MTNRSPLAPCCVAVLAALTCGKGRGAAGRALPSLICVSPFVLSLARQDEAAGTRAAGEGRHGHHPNEAGTEDANAAAAAFCFVQASGRPLWQRPRTGESGGERRDCRSSSNAAQTRPLRGLKWRLCLSTTSEVPPRGDYCFVPVEEGDHPVAQMRLKTQLQRFVAACSKVRCCTGSENGTGRFNDVGALHACSRRRVRRNRQCIRSRRRVASAP